MTAQSDIMLFEQFATELDVSLPPDIVSALGTWHRVHVRIQDVGATVSADPRPVTGAALAALTAGRDPSTDKATKIELTKYTLARDFGGRIDSAAADAALAEVHSHEDAIIGALNPVYVSIVERLRTSHDVLADRGVQAVVGRLGDLANLGAGPVQARIDWDAQQPRLKSAMRLYRATTGHPASRTELGTISGDLRAVVVQHPGWWQDTEGPNASWLWHLLDQDHFEPSLACGEEAADRLATLEAEREAQADHHEVPRERARIGSLVNMF